MKNPLKPAVQVVLTLVLFLGWAFSGNAQNPSDNPSSDSTELSRKDLRKQRRKLRPQFINLQVGFNRLQYRDFATSPLFYKGNVLHVGISKLAIDAKKETEYGVGYSSGSPSTSSNGNFSSGNFKRLELFYSQLYRFGNWNTDLFNTKLGWMVNATGNFRTNYALQNNAVGKEAFPTAFLSAKVTRDISRKEARTRKFWFLKYTFKPKQRDLAFRLNLGLLNTSLRNGYAYTGQGSVVNQIKIFDDYSFKVFSGFRTSTGLHYTRYMKNKNAFRFSYGWDFYFTGGEADRFEMSNHFLTFALLFNTNNQ